LQLKTELDILGRFYGLPEKLNFNWFVGLV